MLGVELVEGPENQVIKMHVDVSSELVWRLKEELIGRRQRPDSERGSQLLSQKLDKTVLSFTLFRRNLVKDKWPKLNHTMVQRVLVHQSLPQVTVNRLMKLTAVALASLVFNAPSFHAAPHLVNFTVT